MATLGKIFFGLLLTVIGISVGMVLAAAPGTKPASDAESRIFRGSAWRRCISEHGPAAAFARPSTPKPAGADLRRAASWR